MLHIIAEQIKKCGRGLYKYTMFYPMSYDNVLALYFVIKDLKSIQML